MAVSLLKRRRSDGGEVPPVPPATALAPGAPGPPKRTKPRLKKLRFLFVLLGLGILAVCSMIFGMMAAVSQDLPAIYNFAQYKASKNSVVVDSSGQTIGTLSLRPEQDPAQLGPDQPQHQERGGLDRGRPLLRTRGGRLPRHRPRPDRGRAQPERPAGRLDDHRAVRQERARSRRQPHGAGEVPRGGARLQTREALVEGENPHRVPEHDLLRRGRLRDRGGRPDLLRRRPPRLRDRSRTLRRGARALGGGDAGRDHRLALGLRPQGLPRKRARPAQPGAGKNVRTRLHNA